MNFNLKNILQPLISPPLLKGAGGLFTRLFGKGQGQAINKRGFAMAAVDRLNADWLNLVRSINFDFRVAGPLMRDRARDLAKNDPIAKKYLRMVRKNVIGPDGFLLRNKAGDYQTDSSGKTKFVYDKLANLKIQDAFWNWSKIPYCSITGDESFRELCASIISTVFQDGEVFIIKHKGPGKNKYGFTLQVMEGDYIDEKYNTELPTGNFIIMGIEYTPYGKAVRYHFKRHRVMDEVQYNHIPGPDYVPVDAANVIHLYIKETSNQLRGITQFAPVAVRMHMLYKWEEACLTNARANANVPWILEEKETSSGLPGLTPDKVEDDGDRIKTLSEAELYEVARGWTAKTLPAQYPHQMHEMFVNANLRDISSGLDVSFHTLASNYLGVSWTSSRTALLDERDTWKMYQSWFAEHFLDNVFADWLDMAIMSKQLQLPLYKLEKFNQPMWRGRRWDWVDPEAEAKANVIAYNSFQKTLEQILGERGMDLEETLEQIAYEKELLKELGLSFPSSGSDAPKQQEQNTEETIPVKNNGNGKSLLQKFRM
jgi:lambda family phage portal protein